MFKETRHDGCHWASGCTQCRVDHPHELRRPPAQALAEGEALNQEVPPTRGKGNGGWFNQGGKKGAR